MHQIKGQGYSRCKESKGEKEVDKILTEMGIPFNRQHKMDGCHAIHALRFDFYLFDYYTCIEFDGIQHREPVKAWGGVKALKDLQARDRIKNRYCRDNGIKLIRIRSIEEIKPKLMRLL